MSDGLPPTPSPLAKVEHSFHVARVEMRRPPHNFFDVPLLAANVQRREPVFTRHGMKELRP